MDREQLIEHLRFAAEIGVTGVTRDAAWRVREVERSVPVDAHDGDDASSVKPDADATSAVAAVSADQMVTMAKTPKTPATMLAMIQTEIGPACTRCKLHTLGRKQVVFGVGNPEARLMFVGEAPGADEDEQGVPFVGRAGQLLTKIIEAIGLTRDDVYIANVIKCRPPQNRNPEPDEVEQCEPFLFQQIDAIKPKVIVALGKFGAQTLLRTQEPISKLRGQICDFRGAKLIPTFHPAYLLRNPPAKREVWEDMKKVRQLLNDAQ